MYFLDNFYTYYKENYMLSRDIDLNFTANPLTGDVNTKNNNDAIKQALRTLLLLNLYEKPFNDDLGPDLKSYLFSNYLINSNKYLKDRIKTIIVRYESRVKIKNITVKGNSDNNSIDIYIEYYFTGETVNSLSLTLERAR
jgi:phage baseplate assembly protein W